MPKKGFRKQTFWKKIRFKYKLSILNENTLEEAFSLRLSGLSAFLIVGVFSFIIIALTSVIIISTPIRNYLPGYLDVEIQNEMISQTLKADSLEQVINSRNLYFKNLGGILRGDLPVEAAKDIDSLKIVNADSINLEKSKESAGFVKKYEEEGKYNLSSISRTVVPDGKSFYRPVKGMVSSKFNERERHYGVDIASDPKESVLATLDGTIIFAGFDPNAGYIVQMQHKNGFISVYKHNAILLKKQGDTVRAGEAIALVGNTGSLSTGTHLHFELWDKGKPVDPEIYIVFK